MSNKSGRLLRDVLLVLLVALSALTFALLFLSLIYYQNNVLSNVKQIGTVAKGCFTCYSCSLVLPDICTAVFVINLSLEQCYI